MQASKARTNSPEIPQKKPPAATRAARQLKIPGSDSENMSPTPKPVSKTPKDKSPKIGDRKSPRTPASDKKGQGRVPELESQLSQLQEDLKKVKDHLASSELGRRQAEKEAEEAKHRLSLVSRKLEESQQQLMEISDSEDARLLELRKISQDRDRAWQSELVAVQKQQCMDSAALNLAMNEIKNLRAQLGESAHQDIQRLRLELTETLALVEDLRAELGDCRESETRALEVLRNTERQLEITSVTAETLRSECTKVSEAYDNAVMELERSNDRVKELEGLVDEQMKDELDSAKNEANRLRSALDAAEMRYQEEYIRSTLQIRSAYEQVENTKKESSRRQALLEEELKKAVSRVEELERVSLTESEEKSDFGNEETVRSELERLRAELSDKEAKLRDLSGENEVLKVELRKRETEARDLMELAKESQTRLGFLAEEAEESKIGAERVVEELDAARAANSELEAELRRLKVQSEQWRKAAEVAAAMIADGEENGGKIMVVGSPYSEDMEEEKKRNGMMKRIGVLWKKGQKQNI